MTFTPSATSSFVAGIGFWGLVWSMAVKIDRLFSFFGLRLKLSNKILDFVRREKVLSLCCTEIVNYSVHGISNPLSVAFALGGTFVNIIMIFLVVPFFGIFNRKKLVIAPE